MLDQPAAIVSGDRLAVRPQGDHGTVTRRTGAHAGTLASGTVIAAAPG